MAVCEFGDAILFTDKPVVGAFRSRRIAPLRSLDDYSRFCHREMARHVTTPFVLIVQWDGYVVDASAWSPSFLKFDYLGAPWKVDGVVGNGGFSLRSQKLLAALAALPIVPGNPEDVTICRTYRASLELGGIRFPSGRQINRFSYEELVPDTATFGFHGVFNLCRHESDDELLRIATLLTASELASWQYFCLALECLSADRREVAAALYRLARKHWGPDLIKAQAVKNNRMDRAATLAGVESLELLSSATMR